MPKRACELGCRIAAAAAAAAPVWACGAPAASSALTCGGCRRVGTGAPAGARGDSGAAVASTPPLPRPPPPALSPLRPAGRASRPSALRSSAVSAAARASPIAAVARVLPPLAPQCCSGDRPTRRLGLPQAFSAPRGRGPRPAQAPGASVAAPSAAARRSPALESGSTVSSSRHLGRAPPASARAQICNARPKHQQTRKRACTRASAAGLASATASERTAARAALARRCASAQAPHARRRRPRAPARRVRHTPPGLPGVTPLRLRQFCAAR
jgi:hypothetical protein